MEQGNEGDQEGDGLKNLRKISGIWLSSAGGRRCWIEMRGGKLRGMIKSA